MADTYAPTPEDIERRRKLRVATYSLAAIISLYGLSRGVGQDKSGYEPIPYVAGSMILGAAGGAGLSKRNRSGRAFLGAAAGPATVAAALAMYGAISGLAEIESSWDQNARDRQSQTYRMR